MTTCFFSRQTQYNLSDQSARVAPATELQSPATRNTVLKSLNEPQICLKKTHPTPPSADHVYW